MKVIGNGGHAAVVWSCLPEEHWRRDGTFVAVGDNASRKAIAEQQFGAFATIVHEHAYIDPTAEIGEGTVIMAGAIVQPRARIGKHCIINTGATVDHDCVLQDYVHIAPGAHLCGNVHVGEGTLVGVSVGVAPNTTIPAWSLVKAARLDIEPL